MVDVLVRVSLEGLQLLDIRLCYVCVAILAILNYSNIFSKICSSPC